VAHQWWGHDVGFVSYRDQWMSEGFAHMSASLYLQFVWAKEPQKFTQFWKDQRRALTEKNKEGFRPIDAGPVTMGLRLSNGRQGYDVYRRLVYPKGAYILHMVRMMMYDRKDHDQRFRDTMHDFVATYSGKPATTENFKAMVEKHMSPQTDLEGNHKMDWFFNEYVYGTALPAYAFDYSFKPDSNGEQVLTLKLTQSGVSNSFRMLVPVYLELADGNVVLLGSLKPAGNTTVEQSVPLKGVKAVPRRAMINYFNDVLGTY
jgi:aminopeptidase N